MKKHYQKALVVFVWGALVWACLPAPAMAKLAEEFNPLCWQKEECDAARKIMLRDKDVTEATGAGWVQEDPCLKEGWGKCLPAGVSNTEIAFGGKKEFLHIGDFLVTLYKYLIGVASILAVIMIVWAGARWASSGGSSEIISASKKRIGQALIGLFIAYSSYFILNTINPALVNLRLPQVWLIKPQTVIPEFCADIPTTTPERKFAFAAQNGAKIDSAQFAKAAFDFKQTDFSIVNASVDPALSCGNQFFPENGGSATCVSGVCSNPSFPNCINDSGTNVYRCSDAAIYGRIFSSIGEGTCAVIYSLGFKFPWADNTEWELAATCNQSEGVKIAGADLNFISNQEKLTQTFTIKASKAALAEGERWCNENRGGFKGFYLRLGFNGVCIGGTEVHYVGRGGKDLGTKGTQGGTKTSFNYRNITSDQLFSADDLARGLSLNIDVGRFINEE